ncbi:MAG TPA: lytic transglycosylase domain-containing protein [Rhodopila sp.]|nr:lytic transglycosylase domain-containing protein [Rhodopila sp.]
MRLHLRLIMSGLMMSGLALLLAAPVCAQNLHDPAQNPLTAVHADQWADAQAAAARFADPVAEKLVQYLRLRAPGAATASEIAGFMQRNPDWPAQAMLERRRQEAIATDPDDASVLAQCTPTPTLAAAILRCAEATANAGHTAEANALARQAWVNAIDSASAETAFIHRWGGIASADDQWARFQRLAWTDTAGAARQIARLAHNHHTAAEAHLAARRADPQTEALVATLSPTEQADPGLFLDRVRAMRRTDHDADALALWLKQGEQAQAAVRAAAPAHLAAFGAERAVLARKLLHDGNAAGAFALMAAHGQTADAPRAEADFLAGFIALRVLHDPARAEPFFQELAKSRAAITQARAHYWLARTLLARGKNPKPEFARAAAWPTTFYGQLGFLAQGHSQADLIGTIRKLRGPTWTEDAALTFTGHEVLRAAAWLIAWGDPQRARVFLIRMDELAPVPAERALTASFALHAGMPDGAVFIARRMGRDGVMLPHLGWPTPYNPPTPPDPAFSLGIMRQESSFETGAVSPSGARGLMQLIPPTAKAVGKQLGIPVVLAALTTDPNENIRLGTAYLQEMLNTFDNCLPLAAAAYNAGPHRVSQWLGDNGDPRTGPVDMVDWVELIPANETRNYVQRVTENVIMYRAALNNAAPILPNIPWSR